MPIIDVYAYSTLFAKESHKALGLDLTNAVLRAEGVTHPAAFHVRNTAAFPNLMEVEGTMTTVLAISAESKTETAVAGL